MYKIDSESYQFTRMHNGPGEGLNAVEATKVPHVTDTYHI